MERSANMPELQKVVTVIEANPLLTTKKSDYRKLNVAAYCRVSTDEEDQINSYKAQVQFYTDHICTNPKWNFAGIYADEGITGTIASKRTRFMDMIRDCEKGKIDLILTKSVSRFARNTVDSLKYIRQLKAMGVGVFFEEQNINSMTADSEMFIGLYSVIAQSESENISANVRWGIQQRMKNGTYAFRYNLLGYRKGDDGQPEIVPEEAEIIKTIFNKFVDGESTLQIKQYLEENHILTKTGKAVWDHKVIREILRNEKYVGDMLMQKTYRVDCISKKTKVNNGQMAKYLISNNHPAIIDRDTFKLVQVEISKRVSKRKTSDKSITELGKYSGKYALSELLICGECGSPYRRTTCMSHGVKRIYWRCLNRIENKYKYCKDSVGVEECKLHDAICRAISSAIPEKGEILSAIKSTLEYAETGDENSLNIFNFEQNIATKKEEAKRIMLLMSTTEGDTEKYEKAISKIYDEIRILREELDIARKRLDSNTDLTAEIKRLTEIFERDDLTFKEFDDRVIRRITECIRVMGDKSIIITLKGGFELKEKL